MFPRPRTISAEKLIAVLYAAHLGQLPTYAYKKALSAALGPSTAYWFKQLTTNQTMLWISDFLQQDFAKRMQKEIDKGVR